MMTEGQSMAPETQFRSGLSEGRFILPRCSQTGRTVWYPRTISPYSGQPLTEWHEVSGLGTVYSVTTIHRKADRGGDYNVALVDLDEGIRMMSSIRSAAPGSIDIGLRVRARIDADETGEPLVTFVPLTLEVEA
jgi:uncharacterized protein